MANRIITWHFFLMTWHFFLLKNYKLNLHLRNRVNPFQISNPNPNPVPKQNLICNLKSDVRFTNLRERERERGGLNKPKPSHYNAAILHWRQWPPASVILLQATTTTMSLSWKGNRMSGPSSPHHNWGHLLWPSPRSTLESTNNSKVGITILWEISISLLSNLLDIYICRL